MTSVLIVDDSKTARMMLKHWINTMKPDFKVHEASSGHDAQRTLETLNDKPLVAVIDYNMPGMNGLELVEAISNKVPMEHIVLCTANIQVAVRSRAENLGVHYIPKPITPAKVKQLFEVLNL